jgi:CRP-like cAMP-binding protein
MDAPPHTTDGPGDGPCSRIPFLAALPARERQRLQARARVRRVSRGEWLWRLGAPSDEFMFVARGRVKLVTSSADGREAIVDLRGPGELLCAGATCVLAPYCCTAMAHADDLEVVVFPRHDVLALLEDSPSAARAFLQEMAGCTVTLCRRVDELTSGVVERRLTMLLLRLADQIGQPRADGTVWIPIALSRQDLAELCNTAFESAIRAMRRLARNGIVETRPRGFLVRDRAALAATANGEPAS